MARPQKIPISAPRRYTIPGGDKGPDVATALCGCAPVRYAYPSRVVRVLAMFTGRDLVGASSFFVDPPWLQKTAGYTSPRFLTLECSAVQPLGNGI